MGVGEKTILDPTTRIEQRDEAFADRQLVRPPSRVEPTISGYQRSPDVSGSADAIGSHVALADG
jgi:hypothetical protein